MLLAQFVRLLHVPLEYRVGSRVSVQKRSCRSLIPGGPFANTRDVESIIPQSCAVARPIRERQVYVLVIGWRILGGRKIEDINLMCHENSAILDIMGDMSGVSPH